MLKADPLMVFLNALECYVLTIKNALLSYRDPRQVLDA